MENAVQHHLSPADTKIHTTTKSYLESWVEIRKGWSDGNQERIKSDADNKSQKYPDMVSGCEGKRVCRVKQSVE